MGHHGHDPKVAELEKILSRTLLEELGPTGKFPDGKLNPDDEGELTMAVGAQNGKIILTFGKPVAWIGFTPQQAIAIAKSLMDKAAEYL